MNAKDDRKKTKAELLAELSELRGDLARLSASQAKWAAQLEAVAQLAARAATMLEAGPLLKEVSALIQANFGLYQAQIYWLRADENPGSEDQGQGQLVLVAGSGPRGDQMVAAGREIPLAEEGSVVAQAARSGEGVMVNDVWQASHFLADPLLPETRSELAVPLIGGDQVLGVLDVQADEVDYFTNEDVLIQTILAAQVAMALEKARFFRQAQGQARREALVNQISQQIQSTASVERALETTVQALGQALQAREAQVQLKSMINDQ